MPNRTLAKNRSWVPGCPLPWINKTDRTCGPRSWSGVTGEEGRKDLRGVRSVCCGVGFGMDDVPGAGGAALQRTLCVALWQEASSFLHTTREGGNGGVKSGH